VFLCPLGRSPVLVDQAMDDLSALDPGSHIDHLAGFYSGGRCSPRLVQSSSCMWMKSCRPGAGMGCAGAAAAAGHP
jgi:hypothetical protein